MENNNELEMMRAQVALLKEKLDKEQLVSEKLLRSIIKKTVRRLTFERMWSLPFILIFIPWIIYVLVTEIKLSMVFAIVFGLYMIAATIYTFYSQRGLNNKTVGTDRLVDTGRRLIRLKRQMAAHKHPYLGDNFGMDVSRSGSRCAIRRPVLSRCKLWFSRGNDLRYYKICEKTARTEGLYSSDRGPYG